MPVDPLQYETRQHAAGSGGPAASDAAAPADGTLLTMADAAELTRLPIRSLWVFVQEGRLTVHRVRQDGRSVTALALAELQALPGVAAFGGGAARASAAAESGRPDSAVAPSAGAAAESLPSPPTAGDPPARAEQPSGEHPPADSGFVVPRPVAVAPESAQDAANFDPTSPRPSVHAFAPARTEAAAAKPDVEADPASEERAEQAAHEAEQAVIQAAESAAAALREEEQRRMRSRLEEQRIQVERLRDQLVAEQAARASLAGRLEERQRFEANLTQQAERLEGRLQRAEEALEEQKRESMTLARALGQAEGQVLLLQERAQPRESGEAETHRDSGESGG